jgi:hypothetical protein
MQKERHAAESGIMSDEYLFHYTTQPAICGIAKDQCLWATNIRYLNDSTEFVHSFELARNIVEQMDALHTEDRAVLSLLLRDEIRNPITKRFLGFRHYIVSLSCDGGDRLSQWRAYSGRNGYSIGWKKTTIEALVKEHGYELAECEYEAYQQVDLIKAVLSDALRRWQATGLQIDSTRYNFYPEPIETFIRQKNTFDHEFARVAAVCKSKSYIEEQEWRIILRHDGVADVSFRQGKTMPVPYINCPLHREKAAIVTCGPNLEMDLCMRTMHFLFKKYGWTNVDVRYSRIPPRDW